MTVTQDPEGIDYFSRGSRLRSIATRIASRARRRMYQRITAEISMGESTRIIDIGLTPDTSLTDSNFFEQQHPHPQRIIGVSPEPIGSLRSRFPDVTLLQASGMQLPLRLGAADVAVSFAVIEHVGSRTHQRELIVELLRVADVAVLTTPNRWFPVELHTFLPLVHWLPRTAHRRILRLLGMRFWAEEANLHLLSRRELTAMVPPTHVPVFLPFRLLGFTSNLVMVVRPAG